MRELFCIETNIVAGPTSNADPDLHGIVSQDLQSPNFCINRKILKSDGAADAFFCNNWPER